MTYTEKILEGFNEKFEWTDFSGDIGTHILAKKTSSYATEETERNELRTFLSSSIQQAVAEERARVIKEIQELTGEMRTSETDKILTSLQDTNPK